MHYDLKCTCTLHFIEEHVDHLETLSPSPVKNVFLFLFL